MRGRALSFLIASVCCVGSFNTRADDAAQIKAKLEAIRKAGEPMTGEELAKWYPEPPAGENAATTLTNAFPKLNINKLSESPTLPLFGAAKLPELGASMSAEMKNSIAGVLASNREGLEMLHDGAKLKGCRYPIDFKLGWDVPLPHLTKLKLGALLLELEGLVAAEEGKAGKAVDAITTILRLGGTLKNEPFVISQLVRFACNHAACTTLERVLNRLTLSDEQLRRLAVTFKEAQDPETMTRAYVADRSMVIGLFQKSAGDRKADLQKAADFISGKKLNTADEDWNADVGYYFDLTDKLIAASRDISSRSISVAESVKRDAEAAAKRKCFCTALFIVGTVSGINKNVSEAANLRCAELVIAIERYRRAHQYHLPEKLEELVPDFIGRVPSDPFGEAPPSFERQTGKGYKISSAGRDGSKAIAITVIN